MFQTTCSTAKHKSYSVSSRASSEACNRIEDIISEAYAAKTPYDASQRYLIVEDGDWIPEASPQLARTRSPTLYDRNTVPYLPVPAESMPKETTLAASIHIQSPRVYSDEPDAIQLNDSVPLDNTSNWFSRTSTAIEPRPVANCSSANSIDIHRNIRPHDLGIELCIKDSTHTAKCRETHLHCECEHSFTRTQVIDQVSLTMSSDTNDAVIKRESPMADTLPDELQSDAHSFVSVDSTVDRGEPLQELRNRDGSHEGDWNHNARLISRVTSVPQIPPSTFMDNWRNIAKEPVGIQPAYADFWTTHAEAVVPSRQENSEIPPSPQYQSTQASPQEPTLQQSYTNLAAIVENPLSVLHVPTLARESGPLTPAASPRDILPRLPEQPYSWQIFQAPSVIFNSDHIINSALNPGELFQCMSKFNETVQLVYGPTARRAYHPITMLTANNLEAFYEWYKTNTKPQHPTDFAIRFTFVNHPNEKGMACTLPYGDLDAFRNLKQYIWNVFWDLDSRLEHEPQNFRIRMNLVRKPA